MKRSVGLALAMSLVLGAPVLAADATVVSGALYPVAQNPSAGPHGQGAATLTVSADGTQLSWTITYSDVSSPITDVYFCSGSKPREDLRTSLSGMVCAFAIPAAPGGPSPITGSRTIVPQQAGVLSSGYSVIQLSSAAGPQLYGYVGLEPMNTATADETGPEAGAIAVLVLPLVGFVSFGFVLVRGIPSRRRGVLRPT